MENELSIHKEGLVSLVESHDLADIIKPLTKEIHLFDSFVAGTTHLQDKSVLDEIKVGDKLTLRREDNKFDSNAILILNEDMKKLGYVFPHNFYRWRSLRKLRRDARSGLRRSRGACYGGGRICTQFSRNEGY